mgnify:FL=1|jgi:hypothetical protein
MEEYKSNSHKSRQNQNDDIPEKRVEKVVSVLSNRRKRMVFRRLQTYLFRKT